MRTVITVEMIVLEVSRQKDAFWQKLLFWWFLLDTFRKRKVHLSSRIYMTQYLGEQSKPWRLCSRAPANRSDFRALSCLLWIFQYTIVRKCNVSGKSKIAPDCLKQSVLGSRRWNWKFRERHATMKKCEKYKKSFSQFFHGSVFAESQQLPLVDSLRSKTITWI